MFKIPLKVLEHQDPTPTWTPGLNFQALLAEAQYKSGWRTLPPPPELRVHHKEDKDTRNVVLQALQTPKQADVPVADPWNKDPLDLDRDANWDTVL